MPTDDARPPTRLDPLGALIYYLCVTDAIKGGDLIVPGSQRIADELAARRGGGRVAVLWADLWWMQEKKLLFDERPIAKSQYFRKLAQRNVNERMNKFKPGFEKITPKQRRLVIDDFVEQPATAIRLIALKDLYFFAHRNRRVPQRVFFEFLQAQNLITSEDEYYAFLLNMKGIKCVILDPDVPEFTERERSRFYWIQPGQIFRNQDMYVELRALDFFSASPGDRQRRAKRLRLRDAADAFLQEQEKRHSRV